VSFYVIAAVGWLLTHWEESFYRVSLAYCGGFLYIGRITQLGRIQAWLYHLQSFHYSVLFLTPLYLLLRKVHGQPLQEYIDKGKVIKS
jgi:hypothetical protein